MEEASNKNQSEVESVKTALREVMMKEFMPELKSIVRGDVAPYEEPEPKIIYKEVPVEKVVEVEVIKQVPVANPQLDALLKEMITAYKGLPDYHKETIDAGLNDSVRKIVKLQEGEANKGGAEEVKNNNDVKAE